MPLKRGPILQDITLVITETEAEHASDAGSTKDIPYLALPGELWDVFYETLWKKWRYNGTVLYYSVHQNICVVWPIYKAVKFVTIDGLQ